jgi:hypothetical protein
VIGYQTQDTVAPATSSPSVRLPTTSHFLGFLRLACAVICFRRAVRLNLLTSNNPAPAEAGAVSDQSIRSA